MDNQDLYNTLIRLDGKNYKAYKDIKANYQFPKFDLIIEHIPVSYTHLRAHET